MSGTPKRPHDESSYPSSKHPHNDSGSHTKQPSVFPSDYHNPYDVCQDSRIAKVHRTESRDGDRRSPLHVGYRASPSSNDPVTIHPVTSENRSESKDGRDIRFENRDNKMEKKDSHGEARWDSQTTKSDKDLRTEVKDDTKDSKYDRDSRTEPKSDLKMEKGSNSMTTGQYWKEYFRGKRYAESPSTNVDSLHNSRDNMQSSSEVLKKEERDYKESREAVGENKVDSKSDDKFKEKDRKRKEFKHPDLVGKEKEKTERRSGIQVSNTTSEHKESTREQRDAERCESDRKDLPQEREYLKEKEKDRVKREPWNGVERDGVHNEKTLADGLSRLLEHGNASSEHKKQKDYDGAKTSDKEVREMKKEREVDVEGDRLDGYSKSCDKESDDGCADGGGATGKEREVHNGVQQRKRMQRTRSSPQVVNRDPHFRSYNQENEGSQGKSEVSFIVYKVGECMQELVKLWREYESSQMENNDESSSGGPTLEIRIPVEHVTATNRQVRGGQLWGTDVYTYDSDVVAVLMHTGYCRPTASPPPSVIKELRATIQVLPPQDCYISTLRNNVRSRAWGAAIGCSYRVDWCCFVKRGGGTINLERCLTHTSTVEPTLAPMVVERTMTTRAAASNALRQQRLVREVTIQYNLCNEPWIKYSLSVVADKGLKKPLYTSARLKKGEVLYLETHSRRYELCFTGEKMVKATPATQVHDSDANKSENQHSHAENGERNDCDSTLIDVFRWSRCKKPLPQKVMRIVGIPLPLEHLEVVEENLDWEDIQWSQTGVWMAGKEYTLARVHFLSV